MLIKDDFYFCWRKHPLIDSHLVANDTKKGMAPILIPTICLCVCFSIIPLLTTNPELLLSYLELLSLLVITFSHRSGAHQVLLEYLSNCN